jgi:acyl-CoA synthetase (AMP-forming)/AMP-acid ligase II
MLFRSPWPDVADPPASIVDLILTPARARGDKPAVIEGESGRTLTYRQLADHADRAAAALAHAGLRPGEPLAIALPNSIDFVLAWYGAMRAGAYVVPINPLCTPAEVEHLLHDSGAGMLVASPGRSAPAVRILHPEQLLVSGAEPPAIRPAPADLAFLPYSSGTTGKPKGVMLTHANVTANIRQLYAAGEFRQDDVLVNMMPLYHAAGMGYMLNAVLGIGATVVLMGRFDLERWLALNRQYGATLLCVPPPVILAMTKSPLWDRYRPDTVQRAACGAAPLGADLQEAFEERTGLVLKQVWGMTEGTCVIAVDSSDRAERTFGSCGRLLPGMEARVIHVDTEAELGENETGEIWLRGPQIMKGYWKQPAAEAGTLREDGWLRTGDIGYFDAAGRVFLVDRLKELIKYNAYQVAPAELEDLLQAHPAVLDAAVIGAPHEGSGEIPMAFVVRRENAALEAEDLMEYVSARVAPHKKIRAVQFVEKIPKSPTGKILRRILKDQTRAQLGLV